MKRFLPFACLLFVMACSSIQTSYDYDKTTDFTKYKTYAYTPEATNFGPNQLTGDRILAAIDREMAARGFTKSDNPDVLIDLHAKLEQKQDATATTTGPGMYGTPWRYGYGAGFSTTQINVNTYTDGTLFINMVDKASEKLVWQGRGTKTLDENASPEKKETNINNGVKAIFEKYPVKAAK
jgi:hypothetical protein